MRRMPVTSFGVRARERSGSIRPSKLSSRPRTSHLQLAADFDDGADDGVEARARLRRRSSRRCASPKMTCRHDSVPSLPLRPAKRGMLTLASSSVVVRNIQRGRLAQLGERRVRNAEVGSSSLLPSTNLRSRSTRRLPAGALAKAGPICHRRELRLASQRPLPESHAGLQTHLAAAPSPGIRLRITES